MNRDPWASWISQVSWRHKNPGDVSKMYPFFLDRGFWVKLRRWKSWYSNSFMLCFDVKYFASTLWTTGPVVNALHAYFGPFYMLYTNLLQEAFIPHTRREAPWPTFSCSTSCPFWEMIALWHGWLMKWCGTTVIITKEHHIKVGMKILYHIMLSSMLEFAQLVGH